MSAERHDATKRTPEEVAATVALEFIRDGSYLSHPHVRDYRGTANGDSEEAWQKDYAAALGKAILTAVNGTRSETRDTIIEEIAQHFEESGYFKDHRFAERIRALKNAAPQGQSSGRLPAEPLSGAGSPSTPSGESPCGAAPISAELDSETRTVAQAVEHGMPVVTATFQPAPEVAGSIPVGSSPVSAGESPSTERALAVLINAVQYAVNRLDHDPRGPQQVQVAGDLAVALAYARTGTRSSVEDKPSDGEVIKRFQRWQLLLNADDAHQFWNDVEWLRGTRPPTREKS